jgi:uncharacterized protein DUF6130
MESVVLVWLYVPEEDSMKLFERLTHRAATRTRIVVFGATTCLALLGAAAAVARGQTSTRGDTNTLPQSAKEVRGASPYFEIKDEPAPRLFVDPPLPQLLDQGVVWIQWRAENVHIVPVFGKGALNVSPRAGHLHVQVDDLPWWWADASNVNTIDMAGLPPGPHKVKISLVNANHEVFPGQSKTVTFTIPKGASTSHAQ